MRFRVSDLVLFRCTEIKRKKSISKIITTMKIIIFFLVGGFLLLNSYLALRNVSSLKRVVIKRSSEDDN